MGAGAGLVRSSEQQRNAIAFPTGRVMNYRAILKRVSRLIKSGSGLAFAEY